MAKGQEPFPSVLDYPSYYSDRYRGYFVANSVSSRLPLEFLFPSTTNTLQTSFIYIIPRIAQDLLNSGSIVIDGASILQPTSTSVMLNVQSHVYVPGPFTVHTEPLHLDMFVPQVGSEYPMSVLDLPENKIHKNTSMDTNGTILTPFVNYTSWQNFVHNTIFLDAGGLGLKGTVPTRLGKIKKFDLDLNKDVPSRGWSYWFRIMCDLQTNNPLGLNGFKGFTIDSARLQLPAEADGSNLFANATLPNQSVLTLEIVSFSSVFLN
jgi:hypothetical protein